MMRDEPTMRVPMAARFPTERTRAIGPLRG